MLPLVPSVASTTSALGSDWDVEAEIAKELQVLEDDDSYNLHSFSQQSQQQQQQQDSPGHAGAAPVEALWAALSARDHLADKLTATLHELESLPQQQVHASNKVPATTSAEQVIAAVAALSRVAGCNQQLAATDGPREPAPGSKASDSHELSAPAQITAATFTYQPAAQQVQAVYSNEQKQPSTIVPQEKQAHAVQVPEHPYTASKCEQDTSTAQSLQQCAALLARATAEAKPAKSASDTQPESPTALEDGKISPARPHLSPPHTPNTEDKRQHAAAAALLVQQQAGQPQPHLVFESSSEQSTEAAEAPSTSPPAAPPVQAVEAAAAAVVAAEQVAAAEADKQRQQEQSKLQQLLQQQAAAAAARQAAQAAVRQQLQQQAEAAAVSYMAAWRIARAWQNYRCSPAHAAKLSAVVALQAAVRGSAARQLLQQMRWRHQLLTALQAAAASGQLVALQQAAAEASAAGLEEQAQHALQQLQAATQAAATDLQRAAGSGTHAAFTVAAAAAAKFSSLEDTCRACAARFHDRQAAAAQALRAAVPALPLPQVQGAMDVALELGVPGKELAAALEAARARDDVAVAKLSAAVKRLATHSDSILTKCRTSAASAVSAVAEPAAAADCVCDAAACTLDLGRFVDAAAACRQYGRVQEAAAADAVLQDCRQKAAAQLAEAARQAPCAEAIQLLLSWCGQLGGLQQECTAAAGVLSQRQQELCAQMDSLLQVPGSTAVVVQQLLRQAKALGVPAEALAAAEQQLQQRQRAAKQQCLEAAQTGSLQQLQAAVDSAEQQGLSTKVLQQCWELMRERQQEAARGLAGAAAGLCAVLQGPSWSLDAKHLLQALQQLVRYCQQYSTSEAGCTKSMLTCSSSSNYIPKQLETVHLSIIETQELQQQMACCLALGLAGNVLAALQAMAQACQTQLHNRASIIENCSRPMDEHPYGATAATQCCSTPQLQQQQPPLQQLQQAQCLWEEGAWPEQSWVQQDSLAIQATLPAWASPPFHITTKGSSKRGCSGHKLEGEGAPGVTALQHSLEHCHLTSPVLQLQGQWAANLQGALAVSHMQLTGASAHSMSEQPQHQQKQPAPNQQQQQQQPLEAPNWLRKLLTANAAAPLGQLTQLDLSLEQLPGLHGLGVLCPQLTSFAVNMNGLRSIEGLQGCSGLVQLSALDNQLQQFPDIACHPWLSCLLLDSNKLRSIIPAAATRCSSANSSSSSGGSGGSYCGTACQPHTALQVLSLTNNQLSSICSSVCGSDSKPCQAASTDTCSSSGGDRICRTSSERDRGSCKGVGRVLYGLVAWLPDLQVLQLSGNQLKDLNGLEGCANLRVLDVSRNQLTDLQGIVGCHLLQQLDVSDNRLATFPANLHLPLLQRLNLSCNAFSNWPTLPPLPHLAQLNLADNQIKHLPGMHGLGQVRTLDLSFNALEDLDSCIAALQTAPPLQELQLHDNAFHLRYQQGGDAEQPPWLAAAAAAGRVVAAGAAAVAYEQWVREQVGSGLPWLLKLDGDELTEAERLPDSLWGQAQQQLMHWPQQQQQQQQQRDGLQGTTQGVWSAGSSRQQAVTIATGRVVASNALLSLLFAQQLKAGLVGGLGLMLQSSAPSAAAVCSEQGPGGASCLCLTALQAAAAWLPLLVQSGSCSGSVVCGAGAASADAQQLPCQHLQQLRQPGRVRSVCRHCYEVPPSSSAVKAEAQCQCPAWLQQVEALWCYSTRAWLVQMQAAEQAAAHKSSTTSSSRRFAPLDSSGSSSYSQWVAGQASAATSLAKQHLLQLQHQSCKAHQQQLVASPAFIAAAQQQITAAAILLQSSWRAYAVRRQFKQQAQQQRQCNASLVLQAAWRGCSSRRLAATMRQQQQVQQRHAAAAAAVKIQAALRGHKVRQRLKAALAAARAAAGAAVGALTHGTAQRGLQHPASAAAAVAAGSGGLGGAHAAQQSLQHGVQAAAAAAVEDGDWDDFEGVPDDFVSLQTELLDDLLLPGDVNVDHDHSGTHRSPGLPLQQQGQKQLPGTAGDSPAAAGEAPASSGAALARVSLAGEASDAVGTMGRHGGAAGSTYEAKITALMAEWGFTDRATAEAYYKRQKHTLKAVAKHKLEQQLKDPAARLRRLQVQLGNTTGSSSTPPAAAAAPAGTVSKPPSVSEAISSARAGAHVRGGGETGGRAVVKHLSLQQQRSKAAEPFSRVGSMSGNGSSSSGSSRKETNGSSSSSGRLLKQSPSIRSDAGQTMVYSEQQQQIQSASLSRSCSQKQHQQGLSLPSISLPSSAASTARAAGQKSAGGSLPKLQRH